MAPRPPPQVAIRQALAGTRGIIAYRVHPSPPLWIRPPVADSESFSRLWRGGGNTCTSASTAVAGVRLWLCPFHMYIGACITNLCYFYALSAEPRVTELLDPSATRRRHASKGNIHLFKHQLRHSESGHVPPTTLSFSLLPHGFFSCLRQSASANQRSPGWMSTTRRNAGSRCREPKLPALSQSFSR